MSRAVANTLLPAARPASTIARPRPRELPVTNHTCAIYPPVSKPTTRIFWRSFSNSGLDAQWVYEKTCSFGGNRRIFRPQGDPLSSRVSDLSCHTAGSCELLEI